MFIAGNFIFGIAKVMDMALSLYMWIVIIRVLISWVNPDPHNPIVRILTQLTEPVLRPIRRYMPRGVMIDFSPIIVFMAIIFLQAFLVRSLMQVGESLR